MLDLLSLKEDELVFQVPFILVFYFYFLCCCLFRLCRYHSELTLIGHTFDPSMHQPSRNKSVTTVFVDFFVLYGRQDANSSTLLTESNNLSR